jgi:hypothetical protein
MLGGCGAHEAWRWHARDEFFDKAWVSIIRSTFTPRDVTHN